MFSFSSFAAARWVEDHVTEAFSREEIAAFQPENGMWVPPLDQDEYSHIYYYSLRADPNKICPGPYSAGACSDDVVEPEYECLPCYEVHIGKNGSISFKHGKTGYADRYDKNQRIARHAEVDPMQVANEQMYSVLHALGEYIEKWHPPRLSWSAVSKDRDEAINSDARAKVYFLWASKNLYPAYVPGARGSWYTQDEYRRKFPQEDGWPDPAKAKEIGNAKKFLEVHNAAAGEAARRRAERVERERLAQLEPFLSNPDLNPNGIRMGDNVIIKNTSRDDYGKLYRVTHIFRDDYGDYGGERGSLAAELLPAAHDLVPNNPHPTGRTDAPTVPLRDLAKADEGGLAQRQQRIGDLQSRLNPHHFRVGSRVVITDPQSEYRGQAGQIRGFEYMAFGNGVRARVRLDSWRDTAVPLPMLQPEDQYRVRGEI